jgi:DNA polymerase-4
MRKIIHIDMDCFYAAVEMREHPELIGQPIAVGGGSHRGVVTTCNYEARKFGVRSAMPGFMARERCPHLIFLPLRFDLYRAASQQIRQIFYDFTPLVEPLSLDEAYLDMSAASEEGRFAWDIAKEIRAKILKETGLTASAGIAPNKMLAKIASDWRKPNSQFAILPEQVQEFMAALPVRKIWGIGPKSAERFAERGIHTCGDLQNMTLPVMLVQFGKWGEELYHLCRGEDTREVQPHRISKSLSNETTFSDNLVSLEECLSAITELSSELIDELRQKAPERKIRKAFVKLKFDDFTRTTKECLCREPSPEIYQALLTEAHGRKNLPIRLLGTGVRFDEGSFESAEESQPELFE